MYYPVAYHSGMHGEDWWLIHYIILSMSVRDNYAIVTMGIGYLLHRNIFRQEYSKSFWNRHDLKQSIWLIISEYQGS